jgi:DNA invertase Pin-like site-specific DNA recombinase
MRVVGYVRVSSHNREHWQPSRAEQDRAIRAWATAGGHRLVGVFVDEGVSGVNGIQERVGLPEAMRAIEDGHADGLVVRELDRLHRDLLVQEQVFGDLWRMRPAVEVFSTKPGEQQNCVRDDPDDPSRRMVRQVLGAVAEYVRAQTVARLRAGKRRKRAAGGFIGGQVPYGWQACAKDLDTDPAERAALLRMRELRAGGASYRAIVAALKAEGYATKRGLQEWTPGTVRRVLLREGA